jgi:iron complex outermembrane receptor protein
VEERHVVSAVPNAADPITGGPINPGQQFGALTPKSKTFSQIEPKIDIRYTIAPDTNLYANWGIGFKSGGFNSQGTKVLVDQTFNGPAVEANVAVDDISMAKSGRARTRLASKGA